MNPLKDDVSNELTWAKIAGFKMADRGDPTRCGTCQYFVPQPDGAFAGLFGTCDANQFILRTSVNNACDSFEQK